jgi:hypothetical protein
MEFDLISFAKAVRDLATEYAEVLVSDTRVLKEICVVDVLEAGFYLEIIKIPDADQIFDLTVGQLNTILNAA